MDEAIPDQYITKRSCAAARKLLVSQWILVGFLLTLSYKSVLRANMMSTEYEKCACECDVTCLQKIITKRLFLALFICLYVEFRK